MTNFKTLTFPLNQKFQILPSRADCHAAPAGEPVCINDADLLHHQRGAGEGLLEKVFLPLQRKSVTLQFKFPCFVLLSQDFHY